MIGLTMMMQKLSKCLLFLALYALLALAPAATGDSAGRAGGSLDALAQANIIRIDGAAAGAAAGREVAGAGDVNGDGRPDVLVGSLGAGNNGRRRSGSAYLVFGQTSTTTVDLAALGQRGFRIDGAAAGDTAGAWVAGAGDVNGDGRADVLVGTFGAGNDGRKDSGSAYVVFGKADIQSVDLASLGSGGFRIDGAAVGDRAGVSVAGAGDVNGDGRPDVLVGASGAANNGRTASGSAYVVFGQATTTTVDLAALGQRGFRIDGAAEGDIAGGAVAGAGDVNGDGRTDVLVGADDTSNNGRGGSGSAYLVFGKADTQSVDLASLGSGGFRIDGAAADDSAGISVAGAGDANGDGRADVLVGAFDADNNGRRGSSSAYLVFGQASTTTVDLATLGQRGFRIDGAAAGDTAGAWVAGAGDVNGDGRADVLVGTFGAGNDGRKDSGSAYVVFGKADIQSVDLASLGSGGFRIDGAPVEGDSTGVSVAGAGDVNGDGRADVLVGAAGAGNNGRRESGSAYLVFGKASTDTVDLDAGADRRPPKLVLGGSRSQPVVRQRAVVVTASCNEACTLKASGAITVSQATIPLRPAATKLPSAGRRTLKLSLSPKAVAQLERALRQGKRAIASIAVRATDKASNKSTAKRSVAVRR